jgi:hypothetical protein
MTKPLRAVAWLVTVLVATTCSACASGTSSGAAVLPKTPTSGASSTHPHVAADVPPPPKVGQCRNTPASKLTVANWVDQTPVVDCSKKHTLETAEVIKPVEKLTLAEVKSLQDECVTPTYDYLGISTSVVRNLVLPLVFWPSPAQRAAGQNWLRCDVGVRATVLCCTPRALLAPQTTSVRGQGGSDPVRFLMCLDQLPAPARNQPLMSCKKPHRTEILPEFMQLEVTRYPSAATLAKMGRLGCAKVVSQRKDLNDVVVTASWKSRADWSVGTLEGHCWIHRKSGLLPPIERGSPSARWDGQPVTLTMNGH